MSSAVRAIRKEVPNSQYTILFTSLLQVLNVLLILKCDFTCCHLYCSFPMAEYSETGPAPEKEPQHTEYIIGMIRKCSY